MFFLPTFQQWARKRARKQAARALYDAVLQRSKSPFFYGGCRVPDTIEGRFECLCLHAGLLVARLCRPDAGVEGRRLAQAFFDVMFRNMEFSLRESGVGDLAVPRRIKKMMASFKGRSVAYDESVRAGDGEIRHALIRNIYGPLAGQFNEELDKMAPYVKECAARFESTGLSDFSMGKITFPPIGPEYSRNEHENERDGGRKAA